MKRPLQTVVATILLVVTSAYTVVRALPLLAQGADAVNAGTEAPPYFVVVLGLILSILGLVAAVGVWRSQRWGRILAITVVALNAMSALPGIYFAPTTALFYSALTGVAVSVLIIVLVLWPAPKAQVAQPEIA